MSAQSSYEVRLTAEAIRTLRHVRPRIVEPLVAYIFGALSEKPRVRGKPLSGDFAGLWSARRGDYRVIFRIDEDRRAVIVHRVAGRSDAYRPR